MIDTASDPGSYAEAIRFNPGGQVHLHECREPSGATRREGAGFSSPPVPSHPVDTSFHEDGDTQ